jgi:glycosyltransferase involved in cell wall biosynthesis
MRIEAIVPAYNEAPTIGRVVAALRSSHRVCRVLVVDDGSKDETVTFAQAAGADVLRMPQNAGKGKAMLHGLERGTCSPFVGFFDADLLNLSPAHVDYLVSSCEEHDLDMCCGLRDYGFANPLQLLGPVITGERVFRRDLLEMISPSCWQGYAIETAMNDVARRAERKVGCVLLEGLQIRNKTAKAGWFSGMAGHVRMAREIKRAERALARSDGGSVE